MPKILAVVCLCMVLLLIMGCSRDVNMAQGGLIQDEVDGVASYEREPKEPRKYISDHVNSFSAHSEWEGVWGQISQCDPLSKGGWCYKQNALHIYGCYQIQQEHYKDKRAVCYLGLAMSRIPDPTRPTEHLICDSSTFPGEVKILIDRDRAEPDGEYFELVCGGRRGVEREECEENMGFILHKDARGVEVFSHKGLDSATCETPNDEARAGGLSGYYPYFRGSFDCKKQGLSKVEKGICNSFYTLRDDMSVGVKFTYAMDFAQDSRQRATLKKEQLQWLKNRNIQCNLAENGAELLHCLYDQTHTRLKALHEAVERSRKIELELVSEVGAVGIYEHPSLRSPILYTKILNVGQKDYEAFLLEPTATNGFAKIMLMELSPKINPNENAIVGYVQNTHIKRRKR